MARAHVVRRKFSVDEYHRLAQAGILREDDRVELIDGEILEMSPIGTRHAGAVNRIRYHLTPVEASGKALVSVQNPVRLGDFAEPQPDIALLRPRPDFYAREHPGPEDVLLVVEVAETSPDYDRQVKVPLYARWGIAEAWLVDLPQDRIEVYRNPGPDGYRELRVVGRGERLAPSLLPEFELSVQDILG